MALRGTVFVLVDNVRVLDVETRLSVSLKLDLVFLIAFFICAGSRNVGTDLFSLRREICS